MKLSISMVVVGFGGLLVLAGCETSPLELQNNLAGVTQKMSGDTAKAMKWDAYIKVVKANASEIEGIAGECAEADKSTPHLDLTCDAVRAEVAWWLAGIPEEGDMRGGAAASELIKIADAAETKCAAKSSFNACKKIRDLRATIKTRAIAARFAAYDYDVVELSPDTIVEQMEAYTQSVRKEWGAALSGTAGGTSESAYRLKEHDACHIPWSMTDIRSVVTADEDVVRINRAYDALAAATAKGLGLDLCKEGEAMCAAKDVCAEDPEGATCRGAYAEKLEFMCGV